MRSPKGQSRNHRQRQHWAQDTDRRQQQQLSKEIKMNNTDTPPKKTELNPDVREGYAVSVSYKHRCVNQSSPVKVLSVKEENGQRSIAN